MQIIARKTLVFAPHAESGADSTSPILVKPEPGIQTVPDWVRTTNTFLFGKKDGSVAEVNATPPAAAPATVPTVDDVMARGYSREIAEQTVAAEQQKFDNGEWPYPAKTVMLGAPVDDTPAASPMTVDQTPVGGKKSKAN